MNDDVIIEPKTQEQLALGKQEHDKRWFDFLTQGLSNPEKRSIAEHWGCEELL